MTRIAAPEIEDQPWFPAMLRDPMTGFLRVASELVGLPGVAAPLLLEAMAAAGTDRVVDLCSGGGGPVVDLVKTLRRDYRKRAHVTFTDLYPNRGAFQRALGELPGQAEARYESTDATAVPPDLVGVRTVFNAFHHLPPTVAKGVLADAAAKRQPILVFEFVEQAPWALAAMVFAPATVLATMPLVRPLTPATLALTYAVPVIPLCVTWDGFASCLRAYSVAELEAMVADLGGPGYTFRVERRRIPARPNHVTCVVGLPT